MPVHKVGSNGYQWGNHGKVYHGPNAKEKASKQGQAAHANGFEEHKHHVDAAKEAGKK